MQMFPLVGVLFAVLVAAVIVLWKAGASARPERVQVTDTDRILNQTRDGRDERS